MNRTVASWIQRNLRWGIAAVLATAAISQADPLGHAAYALEGRNARTASARITDEDVETLDKFSRAIHHVAEAVKPSVVKIETMNVRPSRRMSSSAGSGVIFDAKGYIVTSYHVVSDADRVDVTLSNGRAYKAEIIGKDRMTDVALLKIKADRLQPATFGNSDQIDVGHFVLAIGSPFMLAQTVSHGIVSAKGRAGVNLNIDYQDFIQTDVPTNPGNSGGALVNGRGEVIGINTAIATESGSFSGVAFATPSNIVVNIARRLMAGKPVVRGFLGVSIGPLLPDLAEQVGLDGTDGVLIQNVQMDSPASKSGLQADDVVLQVDSRRIRTVNELQVVIAGLVPGQRCAFTVQREGKEHRIEVMVGEQPPGFTTHGMVPPRRRDAEDNSAEPQTVRRDEPEKQEGGSDSRYSFRSLAMDAETLDSSLIRRYGLEERDVKSGAIVTELDPLGDGYNSGLREGDVITTADGSAIQSVKDLRAAFTDARLQRGVRIRAAGREGSRTLIIRAQ